MPCRYTCYGRTAHLRGHESTLPVPTRSNAPFTTTKLHPLPTADPQPHAPYLHGRVQHAQHCVGRRHLGRGDGARRALEAVPVQRVGGSQHQQPRAVHLNPRCNEAKPTTILVSRGLAQMRRRAVTAVLGRAELQRVARRWCHLTALTMPIFHLAYNRISEHAPPSPMSPFGVHSPCAHTNPPALGQLRPERALRRQRPAEHPPLQRPPSHELHRPLPRAHQPHAVVQPPGAQPALGGA